MSARAKPIIGHGGGPPRATLVPIERQSIAAQGGNCYGCQLPDGLPEGDSSDRPFHSLGILFEDGVALPSAHIEHDLIRTKGCGLYSHWGGQIFFSASDNSSPLTNGRSYQLLIPASMFGADSADAILGSFGFDEMSDMERFDLARTIFRRIWKDVPLPDHGRRIDHDELFAREFYRLSSDSDVTFERKFNLDQLFQLTFGVEGDVAECGVYKGASAFFLAQHIAERALDKRLCLFDSFEGLSSPDGRDGKYWHEGALTSSMDDVQRALAPLGPTPFVELYKGWIPERFTEVDDRRFSFVHIDVDLYQPTSDSLAFFYPRLAPGGIVLLDDYGFDSCPGVTQAIDEFMADKPEAIVNLASGGAIIMKKPT